MARHSKLAIHLSFFLLLNISALGLQTSHAGGSAMPPVLTIARPAFDAEAEQLFDDALNNIWMMAGAGTEGYEAGFALNRVGDHYEILYAPMSYERNMELKIPVNTVGMTLAIAHTHPNCREDFPSGQAHGHRGQGDVFSPIPNFVISRSGVWVTDPGEHTYKRISGPRWRHDRAILQLASVPNGLPDSEAVPAEESSATGLRSSPFIFRGDVGP